MERLEALCAKKTLFDRGYTDKECFVIKRNKNKFWLGKHYVGGFWGPNGYQNCLIFCKYKVNDRGHVDVEYRFGKILLYVFPCVMAFLMCFPIWLVLQLLFLRSGGKDSGEQFVFSRFSGLSGFCLRCICRKKKKGCSKHICIGYVKLSRMRSFRPIGLKPNKTA